MVTDGTPQHTRFAVTYTTCRSNVVHRCKWAFQKSQYTKTFSQHKNKRKRKKKSIICQCISSIVKHHITIGALCTCTHLMTHVNWAHYFPHSLTTITVSYQNLLHRNFSFPPQKENWNKKKPILHNWPNEMKKGQIDRAYYIFVGFWNWKEKKCISHSFNPQQAICVIIGYHPSIGGWYQVGLMRGRERENGEDALYEKRCNNICAF